MSEITEQDWDFAEAHKALGPAYSFASRVCQKHLEAFEAEHMKPLVDELCKKITERVWESVQDHLWSDTEMNLQGEMRHAVDGIIEGILGGKPWVLQQYCLGEKYNCGEIRKTLVSYIPKELQDARIADLESELARLKEQLEWARR